MFASIYNVIPAHNALQGTESSNDSAMQALQEDIRIDGRNPFDSRKVAIQVRLTVRMSKIAIQSSLCSVASPL